MIGLRRFFKGDSGTTLVEFALVAPTVLLLLIGCLDFARAANAYVIVANASREGARFASSQQGRVTDLQLMSFVLMHATPLDEKALTVSGSYGPRDPRWGGSPAPVTVTVRVTYRWSSATWLIGSFFTAAAGRPWFDVSSTMESLQ
jgi:Flp pilus assembly protein TadG